MKKDITWLAVIGINENGISGLSEQARRLISSAELVVGGRRHLDLAKDLIKGKSEVWQVPVEKTIEKILATDYRSLIAILASGDPFCYGIGATLSRYVPIEEMLVIPALSCFSLAAAKLGWSLPDTITIGLNGRALEKIIPHLQPKAKIMALSTDEYTPMLLAELLEKRGFHDYKFMVLEHLGGEKERVVNFSIGEKFARLNMMAIEIADSIENKARALPISCGLADDLFAHDGQITKREIRAITLSTLAPRKGELLWDIGLGAGSVAIEWMLLDYANRAIGFEKNKERAVCALQNAIALGVPDLKIIEGVAPDVLLGVETPDAIFIGGGAGNIEVIETAWNALKIGGRLVVNSVTLETEAVIIAVHKRYGGNITRISIERSESIGSMTGMRPAMSVLQWSVCK